MLGLMNWRLVKRRHLPEGADTLKNTENIVFEPETRTKIGAVTYIVAAHFDDERESLKSKINHLLCAEINRSISAHLPGLGQSDVV